MKNIINKVLSCVLLLICLSACSNYLDKTDYDLITPEQVWQEPKLINSVLVNLYDGLQLDDFDYWYDAAWRLQNPTSMSDEAQGAFQKDPLFDNGNATYTYQDYLFEETFSTMYKYIRNCNDFLAQVQTATSLDVDTQNQLIAEVRFIRALHYFSLAKRYGGVPLINEPQEYDVNNLGSLQVPRNKEVEVYDFIVNECLAAAKALSATRDNTEKYRADKYTAIALASRAALYAGSIAKYGEVQLDGVVGISQSEAIRFFQSSYDASKQIIDSGAYALYNESDDKVQNYCNIFLKGNGDNGEYIFQKQYNVAGGKGHSCMGHKTKRI